MSAVTDLVQTGTQLVGAATGIGTFAIALMVLIRSNHLVEKVGEIHEQTNGMAAKLNEKTEIIAHAAGVQEGIAAHIAESTGLSAIAVSQAAADAAATG